MLTDLFSLDGTPLVHEPGQAPPELCPNHVVENIEFRHPTWPGPIPKIRAVTFRNVGLSKMRMERLTFLECTFEDCLFLGTQFSEVEFHNCTFRNCTFWKATFNGVYIDPDSIKLGRRYQVEAANAGISLFHALMNNFDDARQNEFLARADVRFRQWKRFQIPYDQRHGRIGWWPAQWRRLRSLAYEGIAGYGYKPGRFFLVTVALFLGISCLNYWVIGDAVTVNGATVGHASLVDSIFYTFSVLTVLGFSSVVPHTDLAKLLTVAEALAAIGWLSIFTSILVKRFLR